MTGWRRLARALALAAALCGSAAADDAPPRLLFTGDILLGREVQREIDARGGASPWAALRTRFAGAAWIGGNFEGAVGDAADCPPDSGPRAPCLAVPARLVPLLADAGFHAVSLENNHVGDLGEAGRAATAAALEAAGVAPLRLEDSPRFVRVGAHTIALLAATLVPGRDGRRAALPSRELARRLALAAALADWTLVSIHWGGELVDWPADSQRAAAAWLVEQGASVVLGHHPHVVQAPDCVGGRPVYFSLGNHVFDQKYPLTKQGLVAECRIEAGALGCGGIATETPAGSAFPRPATRAVAGLDRLARCPVPARGGLAIDGTRLGVAAPLRLGPPGPLVLDGQAAGAPRWRSRPLPLLRVEPALFAGRAHLFALQRQASPLDGEDGPRPYVYEVARHGLVARWRGSALAWPLIDATVLPPGEGDAEALLCALHRRDSFVALGPQSTGTRHAVYRWNGFGFSGLDDPAAETRCRARLAAD